MALGPSFPCDGDVLCADPPVPLCLGFAGGPGSHSGLARGPHTVAFLTLIVWLSARRVPPAAPMPVSASAALVSIPRQG